MAHDPAALGHIREQVGRALRDFLDQQRAVLLRAGGELLPTLEALEELLAAGKRLRPAFCYWGWRGAGAPDGDAIVRAASSLELLHACALIHDDVMDGSSTRRGRPSVHAGFTAIHSQRTPCCKADRRTPWNLRTVSAASGFPEPSLPARAAP